MIKEPKRLSFDDFSRRLRAVFDDLRREGEPILVESEGQVYRLELAEPQPREAIWADYDPARMQAALKQSAGSLAGVEREELMRDIHEQRAQTSGRRPA